MKKRTYQLTASLLSIAAVFCLAPATVGAAEKLAIQDSLGNKKFVVHDNGSVGIGTGTPNAVLDISPGTIPGNSFLITATDQNNSYQFKVLGHTGGSSHTQITTDQSDSRLTLKAGDQQDQAPRFQAIGAQDTVNGNPSAARGWAIFDYGSFLYNLPNPEFKVRNINNNGTSVTFTDMMRFIGNSKVVFPNGNVGIGITNPTYLIHLAGGAYSNGTTWVNASSRELKENIQEVSADDAVRTLQNLQPVTFNYKQDSQEQHVGFIAEDVPELVATSDRKGLSSMDITAVLTKVVQEQQKMIQELQEKIGELETAMQFKKDKDLSLAQANLIE